MPLWQPEDGKHSNNNNEHSYNLNISHSLKGASSIENHSSNLTEKKRKEITDRFFIMEGKENDEMCVVVNLICCEGGLASSVSESKPSGKSDFHLFFACDARGRLFAISGI